MDTIQRSNQQTQYLTINSETTLIYDLTTYSYAFSFPQQAISHTAVTD